MKPKIQCILASIFERFCWVLGSKLGPSWRQVGLKNRWKIDPKRLGRFHIALGTFQCSGCSGSAVGCSANWSPRCSGGGVPGAVGCSPPLKPKKPTPKKPKKQTPKHQTGTGAFGQWCLTPTHTVARGAVADIY